MSDTGMQIDTLYYLVRQIGNFAHVRYWRDVKGDGSYSLMALEVLLDKAACRPQAMINDLTGQYGMTLRESWFRGGFQGYRFEVERSHKEQAAFSGESPCCAELTDDDVAR